MEIDQPFKRNFDVGKVGTECLRILIHEQRQYIRIIHKNQMGCDANFSYIFELTRFIVDEIIYEVFLNQSQIKTRFLFVLVMSFAPWLTTLFMYLIKFPI